MTPRISSPGLSRTLSLVPIWLLLFHVVGARAQGQDAAADPWAGVEEMVVSGSTAGGILADVAQSNSVTAFSSEDLEAIGAADISDLANFTPNLEIVTAGSTSPTFFIRGIGLNDFNANAAGAVAVYQDDVPLNSPALQLGSLFDIESANVLRGPQGAGSFRNASAGAIKVYSKKPTGDFGASFKSEFGNYDSRDFEGSLQIPITEETLWARFSFRITERDGTMKNRCNRAPKVSDRIRRPGGTPDRGPWQYCGELVNVGQVSGVDAGQPKWINSRDNWAARAVFLVQPDLGPDIDVDMDWLFTVRGSRRDEPSFLGQTLGAQGTQRWPDPNGGPPLKRPIIGILGGQDFGGYIPKEVDAERRSILTSLRKGCEPCDINEIRATAAQARRILMRNLALNLDKEPHKGDFSHTGGTTNDTAGVSAKGTFEFGDGLELTSTTGWDRWQRSVDTDLDFSPNTQFEFETDDEGDQFFQGLSLTGQFFEGLDEIFGGPLEWETGAFILYEELDVHVTSDFGDNTSLAGAPTDRDYTQDLTSVAGYVNFSWDFWDAFTLDGGMRYNWERRKIDYELSVLVGSPILQKEKITGTEPTGTLRLTWRPTEQSSIYAKYTHGWKSGTFNATGSVNLGVTDASPEKIDAVEIGMRGSYFDDRFNLALSLFHYTYQDYQLFTSQSGFLTPPQFVIINASDVELFGSEVEATILPWEGGLLDAKFAWLEGEFLDFVQVQLVNVGQGNVARILPKELNRSGNRLLNAPKYTITLTMQQAIPLGRWGSLVARWDGTWKDKTYFDATEGRGITNAANQIFLPRNTIGQSPYWIHNVRLSYITPDETIEIAGWIRNVADEEYKVFAADLTTFQKTSLFFVGDPRTFGVTASFRF